MYGSFSKDELNTDMKKGDHLLYTRYSMRGINHKPIILIYDPQDGYNLRSENERSIDNIRDCYIGIQCIDKSELKCISEDTHPEYYI